MGWSELRLKKVWMLRGCSVGGTGEAGFSSGGDEADPGYSSDPGSDSHSTNPGVSTYDGPAGDPNASAAYVGIMSASAGGGFAGGFSGKGATQEQVEAATRTALEAGNTALAAAIAQAYGSTDILNYIAQDISQKAQRDTQRNALLNISESVAARELAASQNTIFNPVSMKTPGYFENIAPTFPVGSDAYYNQIAQARMYEPSGAVALTALSNQQIDTWNNRALGLNLAPKVSAPSPEKTRLNLDTIEDIRLKSGLSTELMERFYPVKYGAQQSDYISKNGLSVYRPDLGVNIRPLNNPMVMDLPGPMGMRILGMDGIYKNPSPAVPAGRFSPANNGGFMDAIGFGMFTAGAVMSKNTEDFFNTINDAIPSSPLFGDVPIYAKGILGVAKSVPQLVSFVPTVLGASYIYGKDPAWGNAQIIPTAKEMGGSMLTQATKRPEMFVGNLAGGFLIGSEFESLAAPSLTRAMDYVPHPVLNIAEVPTVGGIAYESATSAFIESKLINSPFLQGVIDQAGLVDQSSSTNKGVFLSVEASRIMNPRVVAGMGYGAEITPRGFIGTRGFVDTFSDVGGQLQREGVKYAPFELTNGQKLVQTLVFEASADPFTKSIMTLNRDLAITDATLKYPSVGALLQGTTLQLGATHESNLRLHMALGAAGDRAVIVGSDGRPDYWGPDVTRNTILPIYKGEQVVSRGSDLDASISQAVMKDLRSSLMGAYSGTPIQPARNTLWDADLIEQTQTKIVSKNGLPIVDMDIFKQFKKGNVYNIPTMFSSEFMPGKEPLSAAQVSALKVLLKQTESTPGLHELVDMYHGIAKESAGLNYKQAQLLGTVEHVSLTPETQMGMFKVFNRLGTNLKFVGSMEMAGVVGTDKYRYVGESDLDAEIALKEMHRAAVEIGDAFRRGQPVITMQNLSPSVKALLNTPNSLMPVDKRGNRMDAYIHPESLLAKSLTGADIGYGGRGTKTGIQPTEILPDSFTSPKSKVHIAEVGMTADTHKIFGADTIEEHTGVLVRQWDSIAGPVYGGTPEYNVMSGLSRSVDVSKKGTLQAAFQFNLATGAASLEMLNVGSKFTKDIQSVIPTLNYISKTAYEEGEVNLGMRYERMSNIIDLLGKSKGYDYRIEPFEEIKLEGVANRPNILDYSEIDKLVGIDRSLKPEIVTREFMGIDESKGLPKRTPPPEKRGFSFGIPGEEHTMGAHPLEFNADVKGMAVANVAGTETWIDSPTDTIQKKASRVFGAGSAGEKPMTFVNIPGKGTHHTALTGGKPVTDLVDIYAESRGIASLAYKQAQYDLGKRWEERSDLIAKHLNTMGEDVGQYIKRDILLGLPRGPADIGLVSGLGLHVGHTPSRNENYPAQLNEKPSGVSLMGIATAGSALLQYPYAVVPNAQNARYPTTSFTDLSYPGIGLRPYPQNTYPGQSMYQAGGYPFLNIYPDKTLYPERITYPERVPYPDTTPYPERTPYPAGGYPTNKLPYPMPRVWPWEDHPSTTHIHKKKYKPKPSILFREILPIITPIEEMSGFKQGKPFFRAIGNQQILEIKPQKKDYLHWVDVDQDVRELQQKDTQNKVSDMTGMQFFRTATKQEKAKTGKPIMAYNPTQQELNMAKLTGIKSNKKKGRKNSWF